MLFILLCNVLEHNFLFLISGCLLWAMVVEVGKLSVEV